MNPVGEEGNIFSNLFDKVPAKRAGNEEDMAGAIIYLASKAGVGAILMTLSERSSVLTMSRPTLMEYHYVSMVDAYYLQMDRSSLSPHINLIGLDPASEHPTASQFPIAMVLLLFCMKSSSMLQCLHTR